MNRLTLFNTALQACGGKGQLASPTDSHREAEIARLWYPVVLRYLLCAAPWWELRRTATLARLAEQEEAETGFAQALDPIYHWTYTYALPSDMMQPLMLRSWAQFQLGALSTGVKALNTNDTAPQLVYIREVTEPDALAPNTEMALIHLLAAHMCMPMNGKPARARELYQVANSLVLEARIQAANSELTSIISASETLAVRGSSEEFYGPYIYPYGSLPTPTLGILTS